MKYWPLQLVLRGKILENKLLRNFQNSVIVFVLKCHKQNIFVFT